MQRRWLVCVALVSFLVIVISGLWVAYRHLQQVRNGYGEWALAEMIIAYAEDHDGVPPKSWAELEGYEVRAAHLIRSWDLKMLRDNFSVSFSGLHALSDGVSGDEVPQVITVNSDLAIDLGHAQPNLLLAEYFSTGSVPKHVSIRGRWTQSPEGKRVHWEEFD